MSPPTQATSGTGNRTLDVYPAAAWARRHGPAFAGFLLPFLLVFYLALEEGGYDAITRGEVGIALWWVVLVGAAVGVLPAARVGRAGWIGLGLLAAFALWTGLGISWSESAERSVAELGRVAMLLGVFVLALSAQREGAARRTAAAVAGAATLVAILALLSRMEPGWLPADSVAEFLPSAANRLSYPVGYWNGLAHLVAIGLPLVLWMASAARLTVVRALAAAAIPALALTAYLTFSRGGAAAVGAGIIALLLLYPRRVQLLSPLLLGAAGGALLISGASQRDAFQDGLGNSAATSQGAEMLALTLIVCGGVALVQAAIALSDRHGLGPRLPRPSPKSMGIFTAAVAGLGIVAALALGAPGELSDRWSQFKQPQIVGSGAERFQSSSGSNRYQYWESAVDANATDPVLGIGPGTFEFWWARNSSSESSAASLFARDAHSLYLETLAELGIVGAVLIVGFVGFVLAMGSARAIRRRPGPTPVLAAATAGAAAFATAAAVDWAWELTVLPVCFLLLAAVILGRDTSPEAGRDPDGDARPGLAIRGGLAGLAIAALIVIAVPFAGLSAIDDSRAEAQSAAFDRALVDARTAVDVQPYAGTPYLQEALVLELGGDLDAAALAAQRATREEPTNWRPWLVLSRIEADRGRTAASIAAFREARSLNPRSPLFSQ